MNEIPSTQFRKQFAKLAEPTLVTANGHPIGTWRPLWTVGEDGKDIVLDMTDLGDRQPALPSSTQSQRDALLNKINRRKG